MFAGGFAEGSLQWREDCSGGRVAVEDCSGGFAVEDLQWGGIDLRWRMAVEGLEWSVCGGVFW